MTVPVENLDRLRNVLKVARSNGNLYPDEHEALLSVFTELEAARKEIERKDFVLDTLGAAFDDLHGICVNASRWSRETLVARARACVARLETAKAALDALSPKEGGA
jgi:hypothetical protein